MASSRSAISSASLRERRRLDDGRGGDEVGTVGLGHGRERFLQGEEVAIAEVRAGEADALAGEAGGGGKLGEPRRLRSLRIEDGEAAGLGLAPGLSAVAGVDGEHGLRLGNNRVPGRAGEAGEVAAVGGVAMVNVVNGTGDVEAVETGLIEGSAHAFKALGGKRGGGHRVSVAPGDSGG